MAHWNTLEFISQMPNCAIHPIYPTRVIPMENIFFRIKDLEKKTSNSKKYRWLACIICHDQYFFLFA